MQLRDFETQTVFIDRTHPSVEDKHVIALDIGYSAVKGFTPNNVFAFPSFARRFNGQLLNLGEADPRDILYRDKEGTWNVGYAAQTALSRDDVNDSVASLYGRNRYFSPMFLVIARTGLGVGLGNCKGKDIILQTGLPPKYIKTDSEFMREVLVGRHQFDLRVGNSPWKSYDFTLTEGDIKVMQQPMGSLLSASIDKNCVYIPEAAKYYASNVLVFDGGFGTIDAFNIMRRQLVDEPESFDDIAMKAVFMDASEEIFKKYHVEIPVHAMQQCLRDGYIEKFDHRKMETTEIPFDDILEASSKKICAAAIERIKSIYKNLIDFDYLLVTGGTGAAWFDYIKEHFAGMKRLAVIGANQNDNLSHIFSNVRGYYMFQTGQLILQSEKGAKGTGGVTTDENKD